MGFTDVLRKAFPFISAASSLGGPLGVMASAAVGKALGVDKAPTDAAGLEKVIAGALGDPTQRAALLKAEQDFQLQMQELGYQHAEELEQIAAKDRDSARNREIQVKDFTPRILAGLVIVAAFGGEGWILTHGYPSNIAPELVGRILGTLDSALILVLSYYFGSSAGSAEKTRLLSQKGNGA